MNQIDWQRRIAYVEATDVTGRSRWKGEGRGLGFRLSQAVKRIEEHVRFLVQAKDVSK